VTALLARHPFVVGMWLVGSLGRGVADGFSDVDLVVAVDTATPPAV
jgi:predicted nucleotidyltransferase